jgi:hypothetical protein
LFVVALVLADFVAWVFVRSASAQCKCLTNFVAADGWLIEERLRLATKANLFPNGSRIRTVVPMGDSFHPVYQVQIQ